MIDEYNYLLREQLLEKLNGFGLSYDIFVISGSINQKNLLINRPWAFINFYKR